MSASNGWSYQMVGACSFSPDTKSWTDSLGSPPSRKLAEGSLGEDFAIEVSLQCPHSYHKTHPMFQEVTS